MIFHHSSNTVDHPSGQFCSTIQRPFASAVLFLSWSVSVSWFLPKTRPPQLLPPLFCCLVHLFGWTWFSFCVCSHWIQTTLTLTLNAMFSGMSVHLCYLLLTCVLHTVIPFAAFDLYWCWLTKLQTVARIMKGAVPHFGKSVVFFESYLRCCSYVSGKYETGNVSLMLLSA